MEKVKYVGGWKSVFYSMHVAKEVGLGSFVSSITSKNTCKTCAYGMGGQRGGMVNEAGDRIEICKKSMQAQLTDIQKAIPSTYFAKHTIQDIRKLRPREIERLGRLDDILYKREGDLHYQVLTWAEALQLLADRFNATTPERTFFYSSGRSSNEAAFLLHLFARLYGTNNVNNCSYYCHQASGVGMNNVFGTSTATIQLEDLKKADCVFVIGANPASNHPRYLTELMHLRRRGGEVIVINPAVEPGLKKFSIPSDVRSILTTGSEIASMYIQPRIGGDIALLKGIAKFLIEQNLYDVDFTAKYCTGFEAYKEDLLAVEWSYLEGQSGVDVETMKRCALAYVGSKNTVFSWAMGITHHKHGVENVEAICNVAMLRGMIGRPYAGMMPLRGHSNVQGVGSVGVTPKLKSSIFKAIQEELQVKLPTTEGWDTMKCMDEAHAGRVDVAFLLGGNLYGSNPNLNYAEKSLNNIPFKVFLNTTLNQGHLVGVDQEVLILPVIARDEEQQATSQESMFNFVRLSDGGPLRMKNAKSEVEIIAKLGSMVVPESIFDFKPYLEHRYIRQAIAKTIPGFAQLATLDDSKEEFHIEGRILHSPTFNTKDGKAQFKVHDLRTMDYEEGTLRLSSVRSEGQFNTIVYEEEDAWRGQTDRWVLLMNEADMKERGIVHGQKYNIASKVGRMEQVRIHSFDVSRGTVLGYYPETNILVDSELDPQSRTPSFKNTEIWVEGI